MIGGRYADPMSYGGDERTNWTRVAAVLVGLFVAAMVVSFVLKLIKIVVILGLVFIGVAVLLKALRPRR